MIDTEQSTKPIIIEIAVLTVALVLGLLWLHASRNSSPPKPAAEAVVTPHAPETPPVPAPTEPPASSSSQPTVLHYKAPDLPVFGGAEVPIKEPDTHPKGADR